MEACFKMFWPLNDCTVFSFKQVLPIKLRDALVVWQLSMSETQQGLCNLAASPLNKEHIEEVRNRKGTTKKLCDQDVAERSGELSGAIWLKTLALLGRDLVMPLNNSENSLVLFVQFFGFVSPFWLLSDSRKWHLMSLTWGTPRPQFSERFPELLETHSRDPHLLEKPRFHKIVCPQFYLRFHPPFKCQYCGFSTVEFESIA